MAPRSSSQPDLLALARHIDPEATERALADLPKGPGRSIAALLAAAFPPLYPRTDWQHAVTDRLARSRWRARSTREDLVDNVRSFAGDLSDADGVRRGIRRAAWAE